MKLLFLKTVLSSTVLILAFLIVPLATYAASATGTTNVRINENGSVRVLGAEVTSASDNIINAITRFKNTVANWIFTTNASTTIIVNGSTTATTSDIRIDDRLAILGNLTSIGSAWNVAASRIVDMTSVGDWGMRSGTVQSVSTSTGTFVMRSDDKLVTVVTNASTTLVFGTTTPSLAFLPLNSKVYVIGTMNFEGTAIIASKVILKNGGGIFSRIRNEDSRGRGSGETENEDQSNRGKRDNFLRVNTEDEDEHGVEIETKHTGVDDNRNRR